MSKLWHGALLVMVYAVYVVSLMGCVLLGFIALAAESAGEHLGKRLERS